MIITKKIFSKTLTRPLGFPVFLFSLLFLLAATSRATAQTSPRPTDPYADPANDVYNPLRYIANNTLTGIATSRFTTHRHPPFMTLTPTNSFCPPRCYLSDVDDVVVRRQVHARLAHCGI